MWCDRMNVHILYVLTLNIKQALFVSHCDTFSEESSERGGSKFSFHHDSNFSAQKDIGGGKRTHFWCRVIISLFNLKLSYLGKSSGTENPLITSEYLKY